MGCFLNLAVESSVAQTKNQIRRLKAIKLPVVMPSYIPRGFSQVGFDVDIKKADESNPNSLHSGYSAIYAGPNQCNFTVSAAKGGFGAAEYDVVRQWIVNTKLFGQVKLEQLEYAQGDARTFLEVDLTIPPLKSYPDAGYMFQFQCKKNSFIPSEAIKIIQSLKIKNN